MAYPALQQQSEPDGRPRGLNDSRIIPLSHAPCCVCGADSATVVSRGVDFEYATCANEFSFVQCAACGHHYLNPRPAPEALSIIYPPNYGNYSNSVNPGLAFRVKARVERATLRAITRQLPPNPSVLDIGCGDGRLLGGIGAVSGPDTRLEGIEISEQAAAAAQAKGYTVRIGSIDTLDLPHNRYDLICMIQVIEHVFDPAACLQGILRALRPGGRLLIETPSTRCLDFKLFKRRYWGGYHFPRHFNLFDQNSIQTLMIRQGLAIDSIKVKLQPVHWVWTCHHAFQEWGFPRPIVQALNIRNPVALGIFTIVDAFQAVVLRQTSNMQIIGRKPQ